MISNELVAELKERGALWQSGVLPDSMFEAFVLEALSGIDASEYDVNELLDPDAIALLLEHGAQQLKHEGAGGMRIVASGREVDISHLAAQYKILFEQWIRRGWVESVGEGVMRRL